MASKQDISRIKKPYLHVDMNEQQLIEFAQCLDPVNGAEYFCRHFYYIQHPTKGRLLFDPFPYQVEFLSNCHNNRFIVAMMGRQLGKTTTAAGYLLWYAQFHPNSTILIAAHKFSGAQEIMQRIRFAYEECPDHIRAGAVKYNAGSIDFDNGSRIVAQTTTPTTGRGMSISLLYCDEFAHLAKPSIAREFWSSISPTLATGGKAIITSTPNSDEDQFAIIWKGATKCIDEYGNETPLGINGFKAFGATWREHPDRDDKWKDEQIATLGVELFEREHECSFVIADETLISSLKLRELSSIAPEFTQGQVRWYKPLKLGCEYFVALDPSLGTGRDFAAIQVFESPSMKQIAEWQNNRTPIQKQILLMTEIIKYMADSVGVNSVYYTVENNAIGEAALLAIAEIGEDNIKGVFLNEPNKIGSSKIYRKGFTTTNKSKLLACAKLKSLIENDRISIYSKNLISELKNFTSNGASYAAKTGETDDLVCSLLLVVRMIGYMSKYIPALNAQYVDSVKTYENPLPFIAVFR